MIKILVNGYNAVLQQTEKLPTGPLDYTQVTFEVEGPAWEGASLSATFSALTPKGSRKTLPAAVNDGVAIIPEKILSTPGSVLTAGLCGTFENGSRITTNMVTICKLLPGAAGDDLSPINDIPEAQDILAYINDKVAPLDRKKHWHDNLEFLATLSQEVLDNISPEWTNIKHRPDIEGKEDVVNKTTTLSGNPDDVHYPTEKAVVDALLLLNESLSRAIAEKQDELTAGENITIENNVISASSAGSSAVELVDPEDEEKFLYTGNEIATLAHEGTQFTINGIPTYFADDKDDTILFAILRSLDPDPSVMWISVSVPAQSRSYEMLNEYQLYPDTSKEDTANKVTSISDDSTDTQYPSAKAVNDALKTKAEVEDWDIDFDVISDVGDIKGYAKFNTAKWEHLDEICTAASLYLPDTYFPKIKARFLLSNYIGWGQELRLTNAEYEVGGQVRLYFCGFSSEYGDVKIKCELFEDYDRTDGTITIDVQDVTE